MSINNINLGNTPFLPPEDDNSEQKGTLEGHELELEDEKIEDKAKGLSKSLPNLSQMDSKSNRSHLIQKSQSDSNLIQENIYSVPKNSSRKKEEDIYSVPRNSSRKKEEDIYSVPRNSSRKKEEDIYSVPRNSSHKKEENIYSVPTFSYPRKLEESSSSFVKDFYQPMTSTQLIYEPMKNQEEHIYEEIEPLLSELSVLESLENVEKELLDFLNKTQDKCEEINVNQEEKEFSDQSTFLNFSEVLSRLVNLKNFFISNFSELRSDLYKEWKWSPKRKTPSEAYYKEMIGTELEKVLRIPAGKISEEAKEVLINTASKLDISVFFEKEGDQVIIIMRTSSSSSLLNKLMEKFEAFLDFLRSLLPFSQKGAKVSNISFISEAVISFTNFLEESSSKLLALIEKQGNIKSILKRKTKRSYSFKQEQGIREFQESYSLKEDPIQIEEEDRL